MTRRRALVLLCAGALAACARPPMHRHSAGLRAVLGEDSTRWQSAATRHFHLHAPRGTPAARRLDVLAGRAERARGELLAMLGEADYPAVVDVVVLPGRWAMRPFTGGTPGGWALPPDHALLLADDSIAGVPLRHELMHVLSWRLWGTPAGQWVSEGVAMLPNPTCAGRSVDELARVLAAEGRLLPLAELPRRFAAADGRNSVQAASLVAYVRGRFGVDGVRALWRGGMRGAPAALGIPLDRLERDWLRQVQRAPLRPMEWESLRRLGCEPA